MACQLRESGDRASRVEIQASEGGCEKPGKVKGETERRGADRSLLRLILSFDDDPDAWQADYL